MNTKDIILNRGVEEILHFTTDKGITGILATGYLSCRNLLPKEKYLEYIYKYNCPDRSRDHAWWDFVNLSITSVNRRLFGISCGKWHSSSDGWWCILSFDPEICNHDGVYFATTNNMYSGVRRQIGPHGLEAMFAPRIVQWAGNIVNRQPNTPKNQPTCEQAEVLYPKKLSIEYVKCVYVEDDENAAKFESIKAIFSKWENIQCVVEADMFNQ